MKAPVMNIGTLLVLIPLQGESYERMNGKHITINFNKLDDISTY
jgi:hypothetical protein